jgi:hypothetical protein
MACADVATAKAKAATATNLIILSSHVNLQKKHKTQPSQDSVQHGGLPHPPCCSKVVIILLTGRRSMSCCPPAFRSLKKPWSGGLIARKKFLPSSTQLSLI